MKAIKQFNGIDFPLWKKMIEGILEFLKLDYVLYTVKPFPPTSGIEDYDEKMYEYHFKLEQWEKDNKLAKRIIKRSISDGIRGVFDDDEDKTACGFLYLIEMSHRQVCVSYLIKRLTTSRYNGHGGLAKHIHYMLDIAYEIKIFGINLSDSCVEHYINQSIRDP